LEKKIRKFTCDIEKAVEIGICSNLLISIPIQQSTLSQPYLLFLLRYHYKIAIQNQSDKFNYLTEPIKRFESRIKSGCSTIQQYENIDIQKKARNSINYFQLYTYCQDYINSNPSVSKDVAFVYGLLRWFKSDFFIWCNKPPCTNVTCPTIESKNRCEAMEYIGVESASFEEIQQGAAGRTEIYKCSICQLTCRFPRYNDPAHLLLTRTGRCGEWANAFCLICRSIGLDARYVIDWTDHVWVEIWLPSKNAFVHVDCCERALDTPLMYEVGWNKKLHYIVSFSRYGVVDCTSRYTRQFDDVIVRRNMENDVTEISVQQCITKYDNEMFMNYTNKSIYYPENVNDEIFKSSDWHFDTLALNSVNAANHSLDKSMIFGACMQYDISQKEVIHRRRKELRDILGMSFLSPSDVKLEEMKGRISGEESWKKSRGEI
jgi:hypothetical protein